MYGLRKDHRPAAYDSTGSPVRPICGANQTPNSKLSHFVSRIVNDYTDAAGIRTESRSSEEMRAAFEEYNKVDPEVRNQWSVLSMALDRVISLL